MDPESTLRNFLKWCDEKEIVLKKAELKYCGPECGYGLFAKTFIRSDECFLEVPKNIMITSGLIADIPEYNKILRERYNEIQLESFDILVLFFYLERMNSRSTWKPYLDILPKEFTTPLYSIPDIDSKVIPSSVKKQIDKQREEIKIMEEKFIQLLNVDKLDHKRFLWSWHIVNTRCVYCESQPHPLMDPNSQNNLAIIPLMDMMNHNHQAECSPSFDKYSQKYRVTTTKGILEDDQLYVCYGPHDNSKLWVEYGFTLNENIFNRIDIPVDLLLILASKVGLKFHTKNEDVIREASIPCTVYASDDGLSYGIKKNCIILNMTKAELKDWQKIIYDEDDDVSIQKAEQLAKNILKELSIRLRSKLSSTEPSLQWLWHDQVEIIRSILNTA